MADGVFYRSGKAGAGKKLHSHVVYVHPATQKVLVGNVNNHVHEVTPNPDGSFTLMPDPFDGHSHDGYEEIVPFIKKEKAPDPKDAINRVYTLFKTAYENESKSIKLGQESEDFYAGDQWDSSVKEALESEGRACLTFNWIQKHIDDLIGYERKQRRELRYLPIEGGDQKAADILNIVSKVILDNCYFDQERSLIFEDQSVPGRGVFNMYVTYDEDYRGDIKVERFPWDQAVFGPHDKLNALDSEYLVKYQWQSIGRLKRKYKKKAKEIQEGYDTFSRIPVSDEKQFQTNQYSRAGGEVDALPTMIAGTVPLVDMALKEMRVFELQEKIYLDTNVIVDAAGDFYLKADGWKEADLQQVETMEGLAIVEAKQIKVRITRCVGDVLLSDENPADLPVDDFFTFPVYAKKKKNKFWGKVEIGKDPQRETNKRASQSVDIGNRMANYIWMIDESTFPTPEMQREFKKNVGKPGYVATISSTQNPPVKVEGTKFPNEVASLQEMSEMRLGTFLSVSATSKAGANTSASAIMQAEQSVLVGSEFLFDNMSFGIKRMGRILAALIQKYYDAPRLMRILQNKLAQQQVDPATGQPIDPAMLGGQPLDSYTLEDIEAIISNDALTKVDVAVSEANWSPTQRLATLQVVTDAMSKGAPIPFDVVVPWFDAPQGVKDKILSGIEQQRAAEQQGQQTAQEAEVNKTLISKGIVTPKMMEQYGITPEQAGQLAITNQPKSSPPPNIDPGSGLI